VKVISDGIFHNVFKNLRGIYPLLISK